jgi:hypothetical protein
MSPQVEFNLALILFIPWFAILGGLFWCFPRAPRNAARKLFDSVALALALAASAWGMQWSMHNADTGYGHLWPQILATSVAYGLFLAVMTAAVIVRFRMLRPTSAPTPPDGRMH